MKTLLILGGTAEARQIADAVITQHGTTLRVITSWAGRTVRLPDVPGETRVGGFGGTEGLVEYFKVEAIDMVLDATHPFASQISSNTHDACSIANMSCLQLVRPKWELPSSKKCIEVENVTAAAKTIRHLTKRAFLTTGRQTLSTFSGADNVWFLVRLLKKPTEPLPLKNFHVTTGYPPFSIQTEKALMVEHKIDMLISKSSGGKVPAKITAALELDLTIVLASAPPPPPGEHARNLKECLEWISAKI